MSVTANIETRYRSNVLSVPIQSVTTRLPNDQLGGTNAVSTNRLVSTAPSNAPASNSPGTNALLAGQKKPDDEPKPIEVVFVVEGDHVKMVPVKRGIGDDNYVEIIEGLHDGQEVVSGGYKAINHDLADGTKIIVNLQAANQGKEIKAN
jgi:HlyD family secretion protein